MGSRSRIYLLVFKTPYTRDVHKLKIKARLEVFRNELQRKIKEDVLREVKVVVAHPVEKSLFRETYNFNFVQG